MNKLNCCSLTNILFELFNILHQFMYLKYKDRSKSSKPHPEEVRETRLFFIVLQYNPPTHTHTPDIDPLGPAMLKHYNPIPGEDGIQILQKLLHSTQDLIIVSKMVGFEFRK